MAIWLVTRCMVKGGLFNDGIGKCMFIQWQDWQT